MYAPCGLSQCPKEATSAIKMTVEHRDDDVDDDDRDDMFAAIGTEVD